MAKVLRKLYIVLVIAFTALFIYYAFNFHMTEEIETAGATCQIMNAKVADTVSSDHSVNVMVPVEGVEEENCHLMFYSTHNCVDIYWRGECIYSMKPAKRNTFVKTPGCVWNDVMLKEDMNGDSLRVVLTPVYSGIKYGAPKFYVGAKRKIVMKILKADFVTVFFGVILVVIGFIFIIYILLNRKNSEVDKNLAMLGLFAVQIGFWKICDTSFFKLLFYGHPMISQLPFMALAMIPIPYVCFLRELHSSKDQKIWYIPGVAGIGVAYLALFLQYTGILDFRQIFRLILLPIFISAIIVAIMAVRELRNGQDSKKLKGHLAGFGLIVIGMVMDFGTYAVSGRIRTSAFAILGFLTYTIAVGAVILRDSRALIKAGEGVEIAETLVYHDELTGLLNRAAFMMDIGSVVSDATDYVVAVLDLNNLKKCNDTYGHERGDQYIKESVEIIQKTFGTIGHCYRMGGDEFYCLIPEGGLSACKEQKEALNRLVKEYNKNSTNIIMGIACGYARYDSRIDYDLNATAKRADQLMYEDKKRIKKDQK